MILAQRVGSALGLAAAIAFTRGFWDAAFEGFSDGVAEGLGGIVLALVVTCVSLVLVYGTLGSQVEQVTVRLLAIAAGQAKADISNRGANNAAALADMLAVPVYLAAGALLVGAGVREAHATWTLLGFASLWLGAFSLVSALTHLWFLRRLRGRGAKAMVDAPRVVKGGEIAGLFVSMAVLSVTLSASVFASLTPLRHAGTSQPLALGDWARVCVGAAARCHARQVMTFDPEDTRETVLEIVGDSPVSLRMKGRGEAVDASGIPIRVVKGPSQGWLAKFMPAPNTTYEVVIETAGSYSVRYRNAP